MFGEYLQARTSRNSEETEAQEKMTEEDKQNSKKHFLYFPSSVSLLEDKHLRRPKTDAVAIQWALVETGNMKQEEAERIASRPKSQSATAKIDLYKTDLEEIYNDKKLLVCDLLFRIITIPSKYQFFNTPRSLSLLIYDTLFGESNTKRDNEDPTRFYTTLACRNRQADLKEKLKRKEKNKERMKREREEDEHAAELTEAQEAAFTRIFDRHPSAERKHFESAKRAFASIIRRTPKADLERIEAAHKVMCESEEWNKDNGKYVKDLAKWLRGLTDEAAAAILDKAPKPQEPKPWETHPKDPTFIPTDDEE